VITIYEQGRGNGIGHGYYSFERRFEEICRSKSNQAFAFIFYDFSDHGLRTVLKDKGVFAQLDRLSGNTLSIFYLHSAGDLLGRFNEAFTKAIGISETEIPCVAFFRWTKDRFSDASVVPLENTDLIHAFHELYGVIETFKQKKSIASTSLKYIRWLPGAARFVSLEAMRTALRALLGHYM
jgi:hypothetical protein